MFETERLLIRKIEQRDSEMMFEYRSDGRTNKFQSFIPKSILEVQELIANCPKSINIPKTWFQLVLLEKSTQQIIGDIGLLFFDTENMQVELGCTLNKSFQKRGFASEALKVAIDYLFQDLSKHRVMASIDPRNTKALELVSRLGMRRKAHFRESIFMNEQWVDDVVYAQLKKDWKGGNND